MGLRAVLWAYAVHKTGVVLTPPEHAALACLASHHNPRTGLCCPKPETIALETFSVEHVRKAIASLILKMLIQKVPHPKGWSCAAYELAIDDSLWGGDRRVWERPTALGGPG